MWRHSRKVEIKLKEEDLFDLVFTTKGGIESGN